MTHSGRLVLLNDMKLINEIFVARADLVSNKVDGYLESQLRYKEGKHIRTGKRARVNSVNRSNSWYLYQFTHFEIVHRGKEPHRLTQLGDKYLFKIKNSVSRRIVRERDRTSSLNPSVNTREG